MDAFKQQLQRIQDQLSALSGTQRMLVYSLVAVMVLTLLLWSRYAATPDMVPLLSQPVSDQEQTRVQNALTARAIKFGQDGGTLLVSPDDRARALAAIASDNAFPTNSSHLLDDILNRMTPWDSQSRNSDYWRLYTAEKISDTVRLMDGVSDVRVSVSTTTQQRIGPGSTSPRAAVYVATRNREKVGRNMVEGIAAFVAGSIAGIKRADIHIVIDGKPFPLQDSAGGSAGAADVLELQSEWEAKFAGQVMRALDYIPGVSVSVSARVNTESKELHIQQYDEIKSKEKELTSETSESSQAAGGGISDPGVAANTAGTLAIAGNGGSPAANTTSTEKSVTKMELFPSKRDEVTRKPAGDATPLAASVSVPRSWYVSQLKSLDPSAKEPDLAAVEDCMARENAVIQDQVRSILGLTDAAAVTVRSYVEQVVDFGAPGASGNAGMMSTLLSGRYVKEIAVGMLAAVSLLMVMMIVRKSTPSPIVLPEPAVRTPTDITAIETGEALAGIAGGGNPALDGMELAEDDLKSQQMVEQVSDMVKENPDAAAALVKRWLNRA